jgi:peroxiredoxin
MKLLIFFFFLILIAHTGYSQKETRIQITDETIVKDSAGTVYPASVWKLLLMQGYSLRPVDPKNTNTEFLLIKVSEKQQEERMNKMPKPRESSYFKTGESFSSFKTTDINGNKIDIKKLKGKILVINFWFINCGPCRKEIPDLNKLVDSFKTNDKVVFLAVALDDKASLQKFLEQLPFNYTILDGGQFIASQYKINSYPTHVVVDPEMKVYFHTSGLASNTVSWIKKSITELLEKNATVAASE